MNNKIITSKFLKQHRVDSNLIKFFERNFPVSLFPEGLDLSKIEVTGDYNNYFNKIKNILACKYEYNSEGNVIRKSFPSGYIEEYNEEGKVIKEIFPDGKVEEYIYSYKYNNTEEYIYSCSYKYKLKKKKNTTKKCKFSGISKNRYEYDHKGNITKIT